MSAALVIGILVISHGDFGARLIDAASHVLGARPRRLRHLEVAPDGDPDALLAAARASVRELNDGSGVLVLADIYGATPGNIARQLAVPDRVEVLAGASLPMLVRALTYCSLPLAAVLEKAVSGAREGIVHMSAEDPHAEG